MNNDTGTVARSPQIPSSPRHMTMERQGENTVPMSRKFPDVKAGQCDRCGTIDPRVPGHLQYKLCEHYRGMELKCGYCPKEKDQVEVVRASRISVAEHPYQQGTLVVWCNSTECSKKHIERFQISR